MSTNPEYNIYESLGYLVYRASRSLISELNRNFAQSRYNVTSEQWKILLRVCHQEGRTHKELAELLDKDKTGITRALHGLEQRDLVIRVPDQNDARTKRVYLTNRGKLLQEDLIQEAMTTLVKGQKDIDPSELETCKKVLRQLLVNLGRETL